MASLSQTLRRLKWNKHPLTEKALHAELARRGCEYLELPMGDIRGLYGTDEEGQDFIAVNSALPPGPKWEATVHEFAHLLTCAPPGLFHSPPVAGTLSKLEFRAWRIAACFLIPKRWIRNPNRAFYEIWDEYRFSSELLDFRQELYDCDDT